jgi:hypothetical protein
MSIFRGASRALALAAVAAVPLSVAGAQKPAASTAAQPDTIWACFVPTSGTMYRIKVADTKDDCTGNGVKFFWGVRGEKGDKGDAGPQGPKGDAGPQGPAAPGGSSFTLPYSASVSSAQSLFDLRNTDGGSAGSFHSGGTAPTLVAEYTGTGGVNAFSSTSTGSIAAVNANNLGTGPAMRAQANNPGNAINVQNLAGTGIGITSNGTGLNISNATNTGLIVNSAGSFAINATLNNPGGNGAIIANSNGRFATIDTRTSGPGGALYAETQGGNAAGFRSLAGAGTGPTVFIENLGPNNGLHVSSKNAFNTIFGLNTGDGGVLHGESNGSQASLLLSNKGTGAGAILNSVQGTTLILTQTGGGGGNGALQATSGAQNTGWFENTGTGNNIAVGGRSFGVWPTAQFENQRPGGGVALRTFGDADIHGNFTVSGNSQVLGTKNAIVPTSSGMTKVYSEESTELWFTDYGEAQLVDGVARVKIDGKFAETVDLSVKYLVFVQANDDATLYVPKRTATGFEVRVRDGEANASFTYRIVAKRKGFAHERLAPADKYK